MPASAGELKDITNNFTVANLFVGGTTTAQLQLCNGVAQGTTANTRLGRRIIMRSIMLRCVLAKAPTQTQESPVRLMLVYDQQTNGTALTAAQVLQTDAIYGLTNLDNSNRFKILFDKHFKMGSVSDTSINYRKFMKINLPVQFNSGSAGTVGDIQTGSVYILAWSPQIGVAIPIGGISVRIRFSDN